MKNLYFLAAVAAFVLGSCTVEEALDPPDDPEDEVNAIGFGTFLDRVPQNGIKPLAATVGINELKNQGFMVEAYTTTTYDWNVWSGNKATRNFMSAQTVTWDAASTSTIDPGTWTYSPIRYWPKINTNDWGKVTFFAYTPAPSTATAVTFVPAGATNGDPQLHSSMPEGYSSQTDLIVDAEYNVTHDTDNGKVKFNFDHVLSRIGFQAKLKEDYKDVTITIRELRFYYNGLRISGTYTFTGSNKDPGNWDVTGASASTFYTIPFSSTAILKTTLLPLTEYNDYDPPHYLMLIPQKNDFEQAYVLVTYVIHYPTTPSTQTNTARAYLPETTPTWEPGKAYTYTLSVALNAVKIDVEEAGWNGWEVVPPIDVPNSP
jgi:hypothetical protein